jgi:hypothetical protein
VTPEPLLPARGCLVGLVISAALWALIVFIVWLVSEGIL